jgi:putative flavoprotein involved in K+ transport
MRARATAADGAKVAFADGTEVTVDAVVWATGFTLDHSFLELPVFDDGGAVAHERGVTAVPGAHFLGLPWQHTRGSALLGWVKDDAQHTARAIEDHARGGASSTARLLVDLPSTSEQGTGDRPSPQRPERPESAAASG